jgi:TPR repeat protein
MEREEHPSGTSTAVGPSFFVGQVAPETRSHKREETAVRRHAAGWTTAAMAVLLMFAALEWQGWRSRLFESESPRPSAAVTSQQERAASPPAVAQPETAHPQVVASLRVSTTTTKSPDIDVGRGTADSLRREGVKGNGDAPIRLANMYLEGKQVERSCDEAIRLLESAAAKGNVRARDRLAAMYASGACVQRDRVQAYHWLTLALAADPNDPWAQQNRDITWNQMTSEEKEIAQASR